MRKLWGAILVCIGVVLLILGALGFFFAMAPMAAKTLSGDEALAQLTRALVGLVGVALGYQAVRAGRRRFSPAIENSGAARP